MPPPIRWTVVQRPRSLLHAVSHKRHGDTALSAEERRRRRASQTAHAAIGCRDLMRTVQFTFISGPFIKYFTMRASLAILVLSATATLVNAQGFTCPQDNGTFEDKEQCDKYYECFNGKAETVLCPDGLVFDPQSRKREPCDHYFNVDCGDRLKLQSPQGPNDLCPRLNGFYAHPDPGVCNIFYACVEGVAEEYTCSPGLWFDEYQGVCNWPGETDRKECKKETETTTSGFKCPGAADGEGNQGVTDPHPKFSDPADCAKFYICLNGVTPREQGCELGLVFNDVTTQCDAPENVPECKDYYKFLDDDKDEKSPAQKGLKPQNGPQGQQGPLQAAAQPVPNPAQKQRK